MWEERQRHLCVFVGCCPSAASSFVWFFSATGTSPVIRAHCYWRYQAPLGRAVWPLCSKTYLVSASPLLCTASSHLRCTRLPAASQPSDVASSFKVAQIPHFRWWCLRWLECQGFPQWPQRQRKQTPLLNSLLRGDVHGGGALTVFNRDVNGAFCVCVLWNVFHIHRWVHWWEVMTFGLNKLVAKQVGGAAIKLQLDEEQTLSLCT